MLWFKRRVIDMAQLTEEDVREVVRHIRYSAGNTLLYENPNPDKIRICRDQLTRALRLLGVED